MQGCQNRKNIFPLGEGGQRGIDKKINFKHPPNPHLKKGEYYNISPLEKGDTGGLTNEKNLQ